MVFEFFRKTYSVFESYDFWKNFKWSLDVIGYKVYNIMIASFLLSVLFVSIFYASPILLFIPIGIVLFEAYIHMVGEQTYNLKKANSTTGKIKTERFTGFRLIGLTLLFLGRLIITMIATIFLVFPGLYVYVKLSFARQCYVYYEDITIRGAIVKSWNLTKGNSIKLLLIYFYIMFLLGFAIMPYLIMMAIAMAELGWSKILLGVYTIPLFFLLITINNVILQTMITKLFMDEVKKETEGDNSEEKNNDENENEVENS